MEKKTREEKRKIERQKNLESTFSGEFNNKHIKKMERYFHHVHQDVVIYFRPLSEIEQYASSNPNRFAGRRTSS